ncbi:hypothetical protein [Rhodococcus sp. 27YEA6]|uniref:hypothetical protein n=1 Tax=Rhodococcus sp. 27YEA6 TaxID=3156273 RepID=UPI000B0A5304
MSAMTAAPDCLGCLPPVTPVKFLNILPWVLWGWLGLSVAVMAVMLGMLATTAGRRILHEKDRHVPGRNVKLAVGFGTGALMSGATLWILQVVFP